MAKHAVEVRECDRCGKEPANTWTITGPEGAVREIELCDRHGAPVANAYALGRAVSARPARRGSVRRRHGASPTGHPPTPNPAPQPQPQPEPQPAPEPPWR